jgi:hypothetical protein
LRSWLGAGHFLEETSGKPEELIIRRFGLHGICCWIAVWCLFLFTTAGLFILVDPSLLDDFGFRQPTSVESDLIDSTRPPTIARDSIADGPSGLAQRQGIEYDAQTTHQPRRDLAASNALPPLRVSATAFAAIAPAVVLSSALAADPPPVPGTTSSVRTGASAGTPASQPRVGADGDSSSPAAPVIAIIDQELIALMVKRGEDLIAIGDIISARLLFQRAAKAGHAQAALTLARTYDPNILGVLVKGMADVVKARLWYEEARSLGSAESVQRLELLAGRTK